LCRRKFGNILNHFYAVPPESYRFRRNNAKYFLNQLIQCYSNNATNIHHLTTHSTTCWPTKWWSHFDHRYMWRHFTLCTQCLKKTSHLYNLL